jgi:hypothetical protein
MILDKRVSVVAAIGAATIAAAASIVPQAQASPPAAGINATITTEDSTTVRLGGPPMHFTVTLDNDGPDVAKVGLVVSLGHCSCGAPWRQHDGRRVDADARSANRRVGEGALCAPGTGMDFITANLVPSFPLSHGQTVSYELEMALTAEQSFPVTDGKGGIEVALADPEIPSKATDSARATSSPSL